MKTLKKLLFIMLLGAFTFSISACKKESCSEVSKKLVEASMKYTLNPTKANEDAKNEAAKKHAKICGDIDI